MQGPGPVHAGPAAARGGAAAGGSEAPARHGAGGTGEIDRARGSRICRRRGIATREQVDLSRTSAAALEATLAVRSRRRREREGPAAVRDDRGAHFRPHRRFDGGRRQPRAGQRHDAARRHQSGFAHLRVLRHPGSAAAGTEALSWRRARSASRPRRPATTGRPSSGRITFIDNAVDPTTGQIRIKASFPNGDHRLWPGQFVNVVGHAEHRAQRDRRPHGRRSDRPAGAATSSSSSRTDRRSADRRGRAHRWPSRRSSRAA